VFAAMTANLTIGAMSGLARNEPFSPRA